VSQLPDFQKAINDFTTGHDRSQDSISEGGFSVCPHFGAWIAGLDLSADDSATFAAFSASQVEGEFSDERYISALLDHADLPEGWQEAYLWGSIPPVNEEFLYIVKSALYGEVQQRLFHSPPQTPQDALALAYLVEATTGLEAAWINRTSSINYIPMGHLEEWWPKYMFIVDSTLSPSDLAALSETAGSSTESEALSSVVQPERLAKIYSSWSTVAAANSRLPAEMVNRKLDTDWNLLFHPNADREKAWSVIQGILENGDYEDLGSYMGEFWDMKDGNWFEYSRFAVDSPQALWLKARILEWCDENMDDEDEREEALDFMGIEVS